VLWLFFSSKRCPFGYLACNLFFLHSSPVCYGWSPDPAPFFLIKRVHILTTTPSSLFKPTPFHKVGKSSRLRSEASSPPHVFANLIPTHLSVLFSSVIDTLLQSFLVSSLDLPVPYAIVFLNLSYPILRIHPVFMLDIIIVLNMRSPLVCIAPVQCSGEVRRG